jgi:hypothetical protein
MRLKIAALSAVCFTAMLLHPHLGHADPIELCSGFARAIDAARTAEALRIELAKPRAATCKDAADRGRARIERMEPTAPPAPPPIRVSPPPPPEVRADPAAEEAAAWRIASRTNTIGAYQAYLADYPDGRNAAIARRRIAAFTPRGTPLHGRPHNARQHACAAGGKFLKSAGFRPFPRLRRLP